MQHSESARERLRRLLMLGLHPNTPAAEAEAARVAAWRLIAAGVEVAPPIRSSRTYSATYTPRAAKPTTELGDRRKLELVRIRKESLEAARVYRRGMLAWLKEKRSDSGFASEYESRLLECQRHLSYASALREEPNIFGAGFKQGYELALAEQSAANFRPRSP